MRSARRHAAAGASQAGSAVVGSSVAVSRSVVAVAPGPLASWPSIAAAWSPFAKSGRPPAIAPWSVERHRSGRGCGRGPGRSRRLVRAWLGASTLECLARGKTTSAEAICKMVPSKWNHLASCRIASCRIASCRIASCRIASCRVASGRVGSRRVASGRGASVSKSGHGQPCWTSPVSPTASLIGRPTPVPASHAVMGPCCRGCSR